MRSGSLVAQTVAFVVLWASGCSAVFVRPLPKGYDPRDYIPPDTPDCTTTRVAPILDTVFATTNIASAMYVAGQDNVQNQRLAILGGFVVAALWVGSAVHGYVTTGRCIEAMKSFDTEELAWGTELRFPRPDAGEARARRNPKLEKRLAGWKPLLR